MLKRLDQMTKTEAEALMAQSDIAYLPLGPTEGHGSHMPMGCDWYVATAAAMMLAERTGGIAMPPVTYNWPGGTCGFKPTIAIPTTLQMELVKALVRELWHRGFRRIFCVSIHCPNTAGVGEALRELWEFDNIPSLMLDPYARIDMEKWAQRISNFDGAFKEACMSYAAMKVLGWEEFIPDLTELEDEYADALGRDLPDAVKRITEYGMVGYHYTDDLQHQPPRKGLSVELGMEMLEEAVASLEDAAEDMAEYLKYLEKIGKLAPTPHA